VKLLQPFLGLVSTQTGFYLIALAYLAIISYPVISTPKKIILSFPAKKNQKIIAFFLPKTKKSFRFKLPSRVYK
jgi:hypothetical protein